MKKLIALCLVLVMAVTLFAGCAGKKSSPEGTPAEIIEKIYAQKSVEFAPVTLTPDDPDYGAMCRCFRTYDRLHRLFPGRCPGQ